jgi:hypothetical protein
MGFCSNLPRVSCRNFSKYSPDRAPSRIAVPVRSPGLELSRVRVIASAVIPLVDESAAVSTEGTGSRFGVYQIETGVYAVLRSFGGSFLSLLA